MNRKKTHKATMDALVRRLAEQGGLGAETSTASLKRALAMLPPTDLLLLYLRYGAGLQARAISDMLGIPLRDVARSAEGALERIRREVRGPGTDAFDEEFVADTFGPMPPDAEARWDQAKRKPGRPKVGQGTRVISVSLEKGLLARCDALAERLGIARSALIADGLRSMLAHVEEE